MASKQTGLDILSDTWYKEPNEYLEDGGPLPPFIPNTESFDAEAYLASMPPSTLRTDHVFSKYDDTCLYCHQEYKVLVFKQEQSCQKNKTQSSS